MPRCAKCEGLSMHAKEHYGVPGKNKGAIFSMQGNEFQGIPGQFSINTTDSYVPLNYVTIRIKDLFII